MCDVNFGLINKGIGDQVAVVYGDGGVGGVFAKALARERANVF